jgi:uncharacterized protein (DUF488 family)
MATAFSIGYGNRDTDEVLRIICELGVRYLLDVRTSPYSRFSPAFSREPFEKACAAAGIRYVFIGDQLGGRPRSDRCYDEQGRVNYAVLEEEPYFLEGLQRLETALAKGLDIVLMCSELRPEQCHRSKLIGKALQDRGVALKHIDVDGSVVDQSAVMGRITGGQQDLFGESTDASRSRGIYRTYNTND